jgi:hypothetical protein
MEKRQPLQQIVLGKLDTHLLKTKTRSPFLTLEKVHSKWIKYLNVRPKILNLLKKNIGKTLQDTGIITTF